MDTYYQKEYMMNFTHTIDPDNDKYQDIIKVQRKDVKIKDQQLKVESVRISSQSKQNKIQYIWNSTPEEIEEFFINYPLNKRININLEQLIDSNKVKILRDERRIYFGEIIDHKKHGRGITIYKDNQIYQGYYFNNQKEGLGYQIYQNGNVYIGQFQKNKKHGHGTFYWYNLSKQNHYEYYDGQWWVGLPSGIGYHQRSNGDLYEGQFKNGLKHGEGVEHFANGDIYVGEYMNNFPEGYGQYIWIDGSNYRGDFKQGLRNGFGLWKKSNQKNSEYYKGHYALDKRCGYGVYFWTSGNFYKGAFFDDKKHGYGQLFNNNQLLYRGMWDNGQRAEHLNQGTQIKMKFQTQSKKTLNPLRKLSALQLPRIKEEFIKTQSNLNFQRLPKITAQTDRRKNTSTNTPEKQEGKKRGVDMERLKRLATSKSVPKRCGHKNCIPQHWIHNKQK